MAVNVPIRAVTPANASGTAIGAAITNLPAPTKSDWSKMDLSAPDAGRVESGRMLKKRKGKADRIDLEWQMISRADTALVLQAFDPEYVLVEYLDAKVGQWVTKHFYTGDMKTVGWLPHVDSWESVTLPIIRATPDPG
jgi:hypothetical protein